jgi:uncharacterized membrane protein
MNRRLLLALVLGLSFLGIADSWYLYQSAVTHTALSCDLGAGLDGCNVVAQSPYANLLGVPIALYGVGFFALAFALGAAIFAFPERALYKALYALSAFGASASFVFVLIQLFLIKAVCIYCIASAGVAFLLLAAARSLWKRYAPARLASVG